MSLTRRIKCAYSRSARLVNCLQRVRCRRWCLQPFHPAMREATLHQQVTPRMYDASFEHDSCGFGLVSQVDGRASAWVVDTAFDALAKLSHRGGVNADGVSGDGCGVLLHRPRPW